MRARLSIAYSGIACELREVLLKDKPAAMLHASQKGTVPVLVQQDDKVLDESLDIMRWALNKNDPDRWLSELGQSLDLIQVNDHEFKSWLDRYKYHVGYPEYSQEHYREKACLFIQQLESRLAQQRYLLCDTPRLADFAIFPFVRQFAFVDIEWFKRSDFRHANAWLDSLLNTDLFAICMQKIRVWESPERGVIFPQIQSPPAS